MPAVKDARLLKNSFTRVFTIAGGANPGAAPAYQGYGRAQTIAWPQGTVSPIRIPSRDRYDDFDIADILQGAQGLPSLGVQFRYRTSISDIFQLVKNHCPVDLQVHMGKCGTPSDFNGGWKDGHVLVLRLALPTDYTTSDLGALDSSERAFVMETVPWTGLDMYEIGPIVPALQAETLITDEIVDCVVCDSVACGDCGLPSDGCHVEFNVVSDSSGSPGVPASVIYTTDGGLSYAKRFINTLGLAETPTAIKCVGTDLVVWTNNGLAHHWIPISDMVNGTGTWTKVTSGYVVAHGPTQAVSTDATHTWICAAGGYIYFSSDIRSGVSVVSAGDLTTQDLNKISTPDIENVVAVGNSNAVLQSRDGGLSWVAVTGPAAGVNLNAIAVSSSQLYVIGSAGGLLYYTINGGTTFSAKRFPGDGAGSVVTTLQYANDTVMYMGHTDGNNRGRVLRSIDGGYSFYALPENAGLFPTVRRINAIATCKSNPNIVWAGGLGTDLNDGKLVRCS